MQVNKIVRHSFTEIGLNNQLVKIIDWSLPKLYDFEETHGHDYYDILIFNKGQGSHFIDFKEYAITDNSIHIISNNSVHKAKRTPNSIGFSILINPMFIAQLQKFDAAINYQGFFNQSRILQFTIEEFNSFQFILCELKENQNNRSYFLNLVASYLSKLISLNIKHTVIEPKDSIAINFINYLNHNFLNKDCINEFLTQHHITEVVFRRRIKSTTGLTPSQLQHEKILQEAKKLLYENQLNIKEIAFSLGFESETYFCKQFKQTEKITPLEFRKLVQNVA